MTAKIMLQTGLYFEISGSHSGVVWAHKFSKKPYEPPQNSRRQKGEMKRV
jgi:hypothetical protein